MWGNREKPKVKPVLYSYWRSSCSWRVRIVLNLKNIEYDIKPVQIFPVNDQEPEQLSEEFKEINPMRQVPVLLINGLILRQSPTIMNYLNMVEPNPTLVPSTVEGIVQVGEICDIIATGIQPLQNNEVLDRVEPEKSDDFARYFISKGLRAVEKILEKSSHTYCVGGNISMADCYLVPQVFNAKLFGIDLTEFPNIVKVCKNLEDHPAFKAAHPYNQPDREWDDDSGIVRNFSC